MIEDEQDERDFTHYWIGVLLILATALGLGLMFVIRAGGL